jgi:hypothetical protein
MDMKSSLSLAENGAAQGAARARAPIADDRI